jgi:hypothetical protein
MGKSQIKAMTGRNTVLKLMANRNVFYPEKWGIHERINYKAMYSNPSAFYKEYFEIAALKEKR